jgi:hypothetical protein
MLEPRVLLTEDPELRSLVHPFLSLADLPDYDTEHTFHLAEAYEP